ncbi:malate dehydrogenase [Clostridia bacterium]|nr:malate dehydrogenase [Clostridia bacterium]
MDYALESLAAHYKWRGKLEVAPRVPVTTKDDLSLAYTPGVAAPCLEIQKDPAKSFELTRRWNTVAVVTDGSAVLGLGDIGPEAGMPVMEGKCVLFKAFGGIDAIPLCVRTKDVDEFVNTVALLAGSFGGINLEDIAAPRCFEIERKLKERCDIPVFHDDQHGTAIVALAAVTNALKVTNRKIENIKAVICGAGAAGTAVANLLKLAGLRDLTVFDKRGVVSPAGKTGTLGEIMRGADLFIGVSAPNLVTSEMVRGMNRDPIVFAMANPTPEIMPNDALKAGAAIVGTGRSDFPNQINNVLAFPGVFRGALDCGAKDITEDMKLAAAYALAGLVAPTAQTLLPEAFDPRICPTVAAAVAASYVSASG